MKTPKEAIEKFIKITAKAYGFETRADGAWGLPRICSHDVNFTIWPEMANGTNWEERIVVMRVKIEASIGRMGGSPTPEELLKTADEIRNAALMVEYINSLELEWGETF